MNENPLIAAAKICLFHGDCLDLLGRIKDRSIQLILTSPPYNMQRPYETKLSQDEWLRWQASVIQECVRVLAPQGSLCWQTGNFVQHGAIIPLDLLIYPVCAQLGLQLRNRIAWSFGHGLHCQRRFSGRHETILWFTRQDDYYFDLDPVRVPQKYPNKRHFKGPHAGQLSGNPLGKNPGDVWEMPNVKHNHPEKTIHPCQFPVGLAERLVLSMTRPGDWVLDPFCGSGTTMVAALKNGRRAAGAETIHEYVEITRDRLRRLEHGSLPARPMNQEIYREKSKI